MFDKPNISLPISGLEVRPLALRDKDLPSTPGSEKVAALEYENEKLRREIKSLRRQLDSSQGQLDSLRGQLDIWAHQIQRLHKVVDGAKASAKVTALAIRHLQDANFTMKRTEREADKEWASYKTKVEGHMMKTGIVGNQI